MMKNNNQNGMKVQWWKTHQNKSKWHEGTMMKNNNQNGMKVQGWKTHQNKSKWHEGTMMKNNNQNGMKVQWWKTHQNKSKWHEGTRMKNTPKQIKMAWRYKDEKQKIIKMAWRYKDEKQKTKIILFLMMVFGCVFLYVLFLRIQAHSLLQSKEREIKTWPQ